MTEALENPCEDCGDSEGFDEWDFGPGEGTYLCCDCVSKRVPLKSVPQEWIIERD
jgi:hypothetical protein